MGEMNMNKRRFFVGLGTLPRSALSAFAVCAVSFAVGVVAGTALSAGFAVGESGGEILVRIMNSLRGDGAVSLWPVFFKLSWYHLLVFLLGFTVLGAALIPVTVAARGFTLAFTLAALVRLESVSGAAAGAVLLGIPAFLSVPLLFPLAAESMCVSLELARIGLLRLPPSESGVTWETIVRFAAAALLLLLISLGERALLTSGLLELPIFT